MIIFTYNPCFLITTKKEAFGLVGMQTDNILILTLEEFLVLKDNKLNKAKGGFSTKNSIDL